MSDKRSKEVTPPPLLLMPAGGGLTLNPPDQPNLLMPVVQSEPSLMGSEIDLDGEADSFVGQSPQKPFAASQGSGTSNLFQKPPGNVDPFAQVGHNPLPTPSPAPTSMFGSPLPSSSSTGSTGYGTPSSSVTSAFGTPQGSMFASPALSAGSIGAAGLPQPGGQPSFSAPSLASEASLGAPTGPPSGSTNMFRNTKGLARPKYAAMPSDHLSTVPGQNQYSSHTMYGAPNPMSQASSSSAFMNPSPLPPVPPSLSSPYGGPPVAQVTPTVSQTSFPPQKQDSGFNMNMDNKTPPYNRGGGAGPLSGVLGGLYRPVQQHWCYCQIIETREIWRPFTFSDSMKIEEAFRGGNPNAVVSTNGGRYDISLGSRSRKSVYWEEPTTSVIRSSWFYKREGDNRYVPYSEDIAARLEDEYKTAVTTDTWHKQIDFPEGETIVMHSTDAMVHFNQKPDEWGIVQNEGNRPRVVKRGVDDFESIGNGESEQIDHLVFVIHGIGSFCDVKFRNLVECVDDVRSISQSLQQTHYKNFVDSNRVGRVEFIPVHWHTALHGDEGGVDDQLKKITLPSAGKLRHFVNDCVMDVLFYTSPMYCQLIVDTVGKEMNRMYNLFLSRNPQFQGKVSVAGHSLGSVIAFDLLSHQSDPAQAAMKAAQMAAATETQKEVTPEPTPVVNEVVEEINPNEAENDLTLEELLSKVGLQEKIKVFNDEQIDMESLTMFTESDLKELGLPMGPRKKLQGLLTENNEKKSRGKKNAEKRAQQEAERKLREKVEAELKEQEKNNLPVPNGSSSSINVEYIGAGQGTGMPNVNYPQLQFEPEALFGLGSPIGIFLSSRGVVNMGDDFKFPTCSRFYNIFHPLDAVASRIEPLINPYATNVKPVLIPHYKGRKRLHLELKESLTRVGADIKQKLIETFKSTWATVSDFARAHQSGEMNQQSLEQTVDTQMSSVMQGLKDEDAASIASSHEEDIYMGQLNQGQRIDHVLQESPIESFNEYLFALSAHGCYWESEDTVLLLLKELYSPMGILPQMPGPEAANRTTVGPPPSGPPRGFSNASPYTQHQHVPMSSVPPQVPLMGMKETSVPLMAPSSVSNNMGYTMGYSPQRPVAPAAPTAGPPPMSGFVSRTQN